MSTGPSIRVDLRAALPVVALAAVVLAIIVVELCGRDDVEAPLVQATPSGPSATAGCASAPAGAGPVPSGERRVPEHEREHPVAVRVQRLGRGLRSAGGPRPAAARPP